MLGKGGSCDRLFARGAGWTQSSRRASMRAFDTGFHRYKNAVATGIMDRVVSSSAQLELFPAFRAS